MSAESPHLKSHLELLLAQDVNFQQFWFRQNESSRRQFVERARAIDATCERRELGQRFKAANNIARRMLLTIPQRDFLHTLVPPDWPAFILDDARKQDLYSIATSEIAEFLATYGLAKGFRFYGGLKNLKDLDPSRFRAKTETKFQKAIEDTWDVVRFRIVTDSLESLALLCIHLWRHSIDRIMRCRNYYFMPKASSQAHPYRAVHFEVVAANGYPFEVQVMTINAEVTSQLEHCLFKGKPKLPSDQHESWLKDTCAKALIHDVKALPQKSVRQLGPIQN